MRQIAILGGGDWADASVEHVSVPDEMDVDAEYASYRDWYTDEYLPALRNERPGLPSVRIEYMTFEQWLRGKGATDSSVEVFSSECY